MTECRRIKRLRSRRERVRWRVRRVRQAAGRRTVSPKWLFWVLAGEVFYLGIRCFFQNGQECSLVKWEKEYRLEWQGEETELYGVRICPETMEIEFYHKNR